MSEPQRDVRLDNEGLWSDAQTAITVASGQRMDPLHPRAEDIAIGDIAHALARQVRYNGHVGHHLSVARHSIWVMRRLYDQGESHLVQLLGLLHDAAETYLGDMVRPLKHGPTIGQEYRVAEAQLEEVIAKRFGLPWPHPPSIHEADNYVLLELELGGPKYRWTWNGSTYQQDEEHFLFWFRRLTREIAKS